MSHYTITMSTRDIHLLDRVMAACAKEAQANPTLAATAFGKQVRTSPGYGAQHLIWPVAVDYEAAYEFALNNNVPNPGLDPGVITDANISAAVQAHWPQDEVA